MNTKEYIEKAERRWFIEYDYSKLKYIDEKTYIEVGCRNHGSFWVLPPLHLKGSGCPVCNLSSKEKIIYNMFLKAGISFVTQYEFRELVGEGGFPLKFDFAIFLKEQLIALIEYDGQQHYYPVSFYPMDKKYDKFRKTKEHDKRKNEYCTLHKIPLLRIPYYSAEQIPSVIQRIIDKVLQMEEDIGFSDMVYF